jgi:hypothetical protein
VAVDSSATIDLMLGFHGGIHRALARGGPLAGKAEALR